MELPQGRPSSGAIVESDSVSEIQVPWLLYLPCIPWLFFYWYFSSVIGIVHLGEVHAYKFIYAVEE